MNHSIDWSIDQPTNQSINKSINVPVYLPTHDRSSLPRLGVVLLASLGTLHSKPRRRHGSDLFRAVFRCSQVIPTHTHIYIYINRNWQQGENRQNHRCSIFERTFEALLMWWCCLLLPVWSEKGGRWAAHWKFRTLASQLWTTSCNSFMWISTRSPNLSSRPEQLRSCFR